MQRTWHKIVAADTLSAALCQFAFKWRTLQTLIYSSSTLKTKMDFSSSGIFLLRHQYPGEFLLSELENCVQRQRENLNDILCDVSLCCQDRQIVQAHSVMLTVASPFFKKLLDEFWDPYNGDLFISLPDFKYVIFKR